MATWHDKTSARAQWSNAPSSDAALEELLEYAKDECIHAEPWAPGTGQTAADRPVRFRMAQLAAAQAAWEYRTGTGQDGQLGMDGYAMRPRAVQTVLARMLRITPGVG